MPSCKCIVASKGQRNTWVRCCYLCVTFRAAFAETQPVLHDREIRTPLGLVAATHGLPQRRRESACQRGGLDVIRQDEHPLIRHSRHSWHSLRQRLESPRPPAHERRSFPSRAEPRCRRPEAFPPPRILPCPASIGNPPATEAGMHRGESPSWVNRHNECGWGDGKKRPVATQLRRHGQARKSRLGFVDRLRYSGTEVDADQTYSRN